jgi:hypothetical protein
LRFLKYNGVGLFKGGFMGIIDGKILFISALGILYAVAWMLKPQTILRTVITYMLGIIAVLWVLDFFEVYPFGEVTKEFLTGIFDQLDLKKIL